MSSGGGVDVEGWRGPILRHFTPEIAAVSRLTIVADPDELLTEQGILEAIRARGFDLIPFDDHVAFRFAYESRYRERWDRGEETNLVVVLRSHQSDVGDLPYDLLDKARRDNRLLSFSIGDLFSDLAPNIVAALDRSEFDRLYAAEQANEPGRIGENSTKDFVLRHVFEVTSEVLRTDADLLGHLLKRHYRGRVVPDELDARLVEQLHRAESFSDWPLDVIVSNREEFFGFLEERWPIFVAKQISSVEGDGTGEGEVNELHYPGPELLPFDDSNIRAYMDNLFVEGLLAPTDIVAKSDVRESWIRFGIAGDSKRDSVERFQKLTEIIRADIPEESTGYRDWLDFATRWAEWSALYLSIPKSELDSEIGAIEKLWSQVESEFSAWMLQHYAALHSRTYLPKPVMLHHIAPYMAHGWSGAARETNSKKIALLVVDGLALSQWIPLRESLKTDQSAPNASITEGAAFAWVPTLTSVSRQSIFAAEPPQYFAQSISTTQKEPNHWKRFWEEKRIPGAGVKYVRQRKQETEADLLVRIIDEADHPMCQVLGVVLSTVDEMMHGSVAGGSGLHAQVEHWAKEGHFSRIVTSLLERDFDVFVTSDHGNIEATGIGKPNVGATAEERGERVHVFSEEVLRASVADDFGEAIVWPSVGLPVDYLALLAPGRSAFIAKGKRTIGHGGISLEEVIVPFVEIRAS